MVTSYVSRYQYEGLVWSLRIGAVLSSTLPCSHKLAVWNLDPSSPSLALKWFSPPYEMSAAFAGSSGYAVKAEGLCILAEDPASPQAAKIVGTW